MVDAFGTSTPTSTTVVATSTSISPRANACMTASFSSEGILPCSGYAQVGEGRMPREQVGDLYDAPAGARRLALDDRDRLVGGVVLDGRLGVDRGAHDERLVPLSDLLGDAVPHPREPGRLLGERCDERLDAGAPLGHRADRRDVEVAEHRHRDGARDRRRGEHERVRRRALRAQRLALLDAEPVLLVDDDEAEVGEGRGVAQQRVRADDDARLTGCRPQRGLAALGRRHLTGEQRGHELGCERAAPASARSSAGADRRAPRSGRSAPTGRRSGRPGASPAARRASCPSRPRPARAGSSASRPRGRARSGRRRRPGRACARTAATRRSRRAAHPARGGSPSSARTNWRCCSRATCSTKASCMRSVLRACSI